jgi:hypothetical protein
LRFTTVGGSSSDNVNMASHTCEINMAKAGDKFFGNTTGGWAANQWDESIRRTSTSVNANLVHCGLIAPKAITDIQLFATAIPALRADLTVDIFGATRPPNNTSTAMTITRLGGTTTTVGSTGVPYSMDVTLTGLNVRAGQLLFVMFSRAGSNVTSAITPFTFTLVGE